MLVLGAGQVESQPFLGAVMPQLAILLQIIQPLPSWESYPDLVQGKSWDSPPTKWVMSHALIGKIAISLHAENEIWDGFLRTTVWDGGRVILLPPPLLAVFPMPCWRIVAFGEKCANFTTQQVEKEEEEGESWMHSLS